MKFKIPTTIVLFLAFIVTPFSAHAQNIPQCVAGVNIADAAIETIRGVQRQLVNNYRNNRVARINTIMANAESKLNNLRTKADVDRDRTYNQLRNRANTPEENAAVETFEVNVEGLVGVRRAAVDGAVNGFQSDVQQFITDVDSAIDDIFDTHEGVTDTAIVEARTRCQDGDSINSVRSYLIGELDRAEAEAESVRTSYDFRDQYVAIEQNRSAMVEEAIAQFTEDYSIEVAELYEVFNQ